MQSDFMDDQQRQSGSESSDESESQTNNDFQTSPFGSETDSEVESESKSQIPSDWNNPGHLILVILVLMRSLILSLSLWNLSKIQRKNLIVNQLLSQTRAGQTNLDRDPLS